MPVEDPAFSGDLIRHDGLKLMPFLTCPPFKMFCWICAFINLVHGFINTVTYYNLTAEIAEPRLKGSGMQAHAEVISAMTRPKIFF